MPQSKIKNQTLTNTLRTLALLLLLTAIALLWASTTHAQCAIYVNQKTGAMGWAYNSRNEHYTSEQLWKMAQESCYSQGGSYCEKLHSSNESGWWCVIRGYNGGLYCFAGSAGNNTEQDAFNNAKKDFDQRFGSIEYEKWTWYVYSNSPH